MRIFVVILILLSPQIAKADDLMKKYRQELLNKDNNFKGQGLDLRDEYKDSFTNNELEKVERPQPQVEPPVEAPKAAIKPQNPEKHSFSKEEAEAMGRMMMQGINGQPGLVPGIMPNLPKK